MKIYKGYFLSILIFVVSCRNEQNKNLQKHENPNLQTIKNSQTTAAAMTKFELKPFLTIEGVGAASGLVYHQEKLFIIGDNSGFLYEYNLENKKLQSFPLVKNALNLTPKKIKEDFESITLHNGSLQIFGSGSTKKRDKQIGFSLADNSITKLSAKNLYKKFLETAMISDKDLNIEGAVFHNDKQYFFQRGNGEQSTNGIFIVSGDDIEFKSIALPIILGLQCGFTDAIVHDDKCYFLATAENTNSTYFDGEIMGSIFGCLNLDTFIIEYAVQIASTEKMEGITFYKSDDKTITFLICEDNDIEELKSNIYELTIYK